MRGVYPKKNCPRFEKARRRRTQNLELREEYAYLQIWPGEKYSFHLKNTDLRNQKTYLIIRWVMDNMAANIFCKQLLPVVYPEGTV